MVDYSWKWPLAGVSALVLAGGLLGIAAPSSLAVGRRAPSVSIGLRSSYPKLTGDVYVATYPKAATKAKASGAVSGAHSGEVAELFAQQFPFRAHEHKIGSVTLSAHGGRAPYSFTVKPLLATRYRVKVFGAGGTGPALATSTKVTLFVTTGGYFRPSTAPPCGRPVCHQRFTSTYFVPVSVARRENAKRIYKYFGLNLRPVTEPPPPKWLYLTKIVAVSKPRRVSAGEYRQTVTFSFRIGNDGYYFGWATCTRDTEAQDGFGLPGHHGCGDKRVLRTSRYLG